MTADVVMAPLLALQRIRSNAQFAIEGGAVFDLQRCVALCNAVLNNQPQRCDSRVVAAEASAKLMSSIREYGRLMREAGMDQASDFRDRRRDGQATEVAAVECLAEIEPAVTDLFNALCAIVTECAGPGKPLCGDSYLPPELLDPARKAVANVMREAA